MEKLRRLTIPHQQPPEPQLLHQTVENLIAVRNAAANWQLRMHFTYQSAHSSADLQQGDILARTSALEKIIKEIHPYYLKTDYTCYLVLTQSCDLAKRSDEITARYITICAARPLSVAISKEAVKYQDSITSKANAISDRNRDRLRMFLERLLNNNNHEYFYLHDESMVGLQRSCAFLRLSIAVHQMHYGVMQAARTLALSNSFQAKLGWLVGNIYSRVGTEDWSPTTMNAEEWKDFVGTVLDEHLHFVPEPNLKAYKKSSGKLPPPRQVGGRHSRRNSQNRRSETQR